MAFRDHKRLSDYYIPENGEWSIMNKGKKSEDGITLLDVFAVIAIIGAGLSVFIFIGDIK